MCGSKDEAETKIDRLIRSMDRLSLALERAEERTVAGPSKGSIDKAEPIVPSTRSHLRR